MIFFDFFPSFLGFYWFLLAFAEFYCVLLPFIGFTGLRSWTESYCVMHC